MHVFGAKEAQWKNQWHDHQKKFWTVNVFCALPRYLPTVKSSMENCKWPAKIGQKVGFEKVSLLSRPQENNTQEKVLLFFQVDYCNDILSAIKNRASAFYKVVLL